MNKIEYCFVTIQFWLFVSHVNSLTRLLNVSILLSLILLIDQNIFAHECHIVRNNLLTLGDKIVDNFEDEKIEKVFLDTDFKDRTILKIVT